MVNLNSDRNSYVQPTTSSAAKSIDEKQKEWTALSKAVQDGDIKYVRKLLVHGADHLPRSEKSGMTALHAAATFGHAKIIKLFKNSTIIDAQAKDGLTALHCACIFEKTKAVKALLKIGANPDMKFFGSTALHTAAERGNVGIIKLFEGYKVIHAQTTDQLTALDIAQGYQVYTKNNAVKALLAMGAINSIAARALPKLLDKNAVDKGDDTVDLLSFESQVTKSSISRQAAAISALSYRIADKYMEGQKVPKLPFTSNTTNAHSWLNQPSFSMQSLESLSVNDKPRSKPSSKEIDLGHLKATHLFSQSLDINVSRVTFVFPGRGQNARIPEEAAGGQVVLVVPEKDALVANDWVNQSTSVLIVKKLKSAFYRGKIKDEQLGLLTSRRLAAFYFAQDLKLKSFILLDDNLEHFYCDGGQKKTWPNLYESIKKTAQSTDVTCLSARTYRPDEDADVPRSLTPAVHMGKLGSKLFYFNGEKLFNLCQTPEKLSHILPPEVDIWGEDVWLQLYLEAAGQKAGIIDRKALIFTRIKSGKKGVCASTIEKADSWLSGSMEIYTAKDEFAQAALEGIKAIVKSNLDIRKAELKRLANKDLGQRSQKKGSKDFLDDSLLNITERTPLPEKKKRQEPNEEEKVKLEPAVWDKAPQNEQGALLIKEMGVALEKLAPMTEKNLFFPHQIKAFTALKEVLQKGIYTGYFDMATGTGKTNIFLALTALWLQCETFKNKNIAIIAPTIELVSQIYEEIELFNKKFFPLNLDINSVVKVSSEDTTQAIIAINEGVQAGGKVLIVCNPSMKHFLSSEKNRAELFSLYLIDELHKASDDLLKYVSAYSSKGNALTYGFSATPGQRAAALGKNPIFSYSTLDGVRDGFLCPWIINSFKAACTEKHIDEFIQKLPVFLKETPHPKDRNLHKNRGIIWVSTIERANEVADLLQKNNLNAFAVHSKNKDNEVVINHFKKQSPIVKILVAVEMLKLGFDAMIDYAIIARKINKLDSWLQMRGRIVRGGTRFDTVQKVDPDTICAPARKIAYFVTFKDALPAHNEHLFADQDELVCSPDYLGMDDFVDLERDDLDDLLTETKKGDFQLQPYVSPPVLKHAIPEPAI